MLQGSLIWFTLRRVSTSPDEELGCVDGVPRAILGHWLKQSCVLRESQDLTMDMSDVMAHVHFVRVPSHIMTRDGTHQLDWAHMSPMSCALTIVYTLPSHTSGTGSPNDGVQIHDMFHYASVRVLGYATWDELRRTRGMLYIHDLHRKKSDALVLPWEISDDLAQLDLDTSLPPQQWCWYVAWRPHDTGSRTASSTVRGTAATVTLDHVTQYMDWLYASARTYYGCDRNKDRDADGPVSDRFETPQEALWTMWDNDTAHESKDTVRQWRRYNAMHAACPSGLTPEQDMHAHVVAMQLAALVVYLWPTLGESYSRMHCDVLQSLWDWRVDRFCQNEQAVYQLAMYNGLSRALSDDVNTLSSHVPLRIIPTPLAIDQQYFIETHQLVQGCDMLHGVADVFFAVPYQDAPPPIDPGKPYPMHAGGMAHLAWDGVLDWMQCKQRHFEDMVVSAWAYHTVLPFAYYTNNDKQPVLINTSRACRDICRGQYRGLLDKAQRAAAYMHKMQPWQQFQTQSCNGHALSDGNSNSRSDIDMHVPSNFKDALDMFLDMSPPCIQQLIHSNQHPKYNQRIALGTQLHAGRLPKAMGDVVFTHVGRKHPDIEDLASIDIVKKWHDWSWAWEKGQGASKCDVFIDNARNGYHATHITCPFATKTNGHDNADNAICKTQCTQQFMTRFPKKYRDRTPLHRPFQWYLWVLLRSG